MAARWSDTSVETGHRQRRLVTILALQVVGLVALVTLVTAGPASAQGPGEPTSIATGNEATCAVVDGALSCWGQIPPSLAAGDPNLLPVPIDGVQDVVAVAQGERHVCALGSGGTVSCFGANQRGQLGDGTTIDRSEPVAVQGLDDAVAVSAGLSHTCALRSGGTVDCWGNNFRGRLGDGTTIDQPTPVPVLGLSNVIAIEAGWEHTCALLADGGLRCWGDNVEGQLGDGTTATSASPVAVVGINDAVSVSGGDGHTCAALAAGTVSCWGRNWAGQLGDGTLDPSPTPVAVLGVTGAATVSAAVVHSCALLDDGRVQCWGRSGLLGDGSDLGDGDGVLAVDAIGLTQVTSIEAGLRHSCATATTGAFCWGTNRNGELGVGDAIGRTIPTPVLFGPVEVGISGRVVDDAGQAVPNVTVDLYTAGRASYLRSVATAADGTWGFVAVQPGCYVVTVVAPPFTRFADGSEFLNVDVCVTAGQPVTGIDATVTDLREDRVGITARVIDDATLDPVGGVTVDLFTGDEEGNRLDYLQSAATSADGQIDFGLFEPGCYVLTYIAPDGTTLRSPGGLDEGRWLNRPACLDPGVTFASSARLVGQTESGTLTVSIVDGSGAPVDGVVVDLFTAAADGRRASYVRSVSTVGGVSDFTVPAGCFVAVAIAPDGRSFSGGSPWFEWPACVEGGGVDAVTATLD